MLLLLYSNPSLTGREIAARIGLSQRGMEKQIKRLKDLGVITRVGSNKGGHWEVISNEAEG
ncbi:MAG: winged helix-turn-helix domain-containing protein [Bacteroidales bacterium]|nr:winged helix-turn-helix domain-containing protein [Bacteroidales bacterium]